MYNLSHCCQRWCGRSLCCLGLGNCQSLQCSGSILRISLTQVVGRVPPSQLLWFAKPHLDFTKTILAVQDRCGNFAHHTAQLVFLAQLAMFQIFFIVFLIVPMLLIIRTYKIALIVSNSIQHLLKYGFRLSGCPSHRCSISHIFLLLHNCSLCFSISISRHSSLSIPLILDPVLIVFVAFKLCFTLCLPQNLLSTS